MISVREPAYEPYFADPFLTRFDGVWYAYGTAGPGHDDDFTFEAISSTDLIHWTSAGSVLARPDPSLGGDFWAPEVVASAGSFWMYYSVGHDIAGHHLRVARADTPLGPFVDLGRVAKAFWVASGRVLMGVA